MRRTVNGRELSILARRNLDRRGMTYYVHEFRPSDIDPEINWPSNTLIGVIVSHDGPGVKDHSNVRWFDWYAPGEDEAMNWSRTLNDALWENVRPISNVSESNELSHNREVRLQGGEAMKN